MGKLEEIERRLGKLEKWVKGINDKRCYFTDNQIEKIKKKIK